ncbi:SGNH/GDSL hydrolase family protein [Mycoplasma leonicaptivi]|uniref:SGNH/GDSL hydrolase family protein n=1 Tax=Mycoplasma leonicaptivi TaxID=36742 RepID=UPI000480F3CF|nr:SGNH/GDSL hydrolase family protein [Mycoplasma leonicaptivi]
MKKNKIILSLSALLVSVSTIASCKAPGSSKPLPFTTEKPEEETKEFISAPGLPIKPIDVTSIDPINNNGIYKANLVDILDNVQKEKSKNFIALDQKIRYVALGDSITAGFDGTLTRDYQGSKNENGEITGVSYPSFLARILDQNGRVESYDNFAISGSTTADWINLLKIDYQSNKFKNKSVDYLFGDSEQYSKKVKDKLKDANLITLSLGANDVFELLFSSIKENDAFKIIKKFLEKKPLISDAITLVNDVLKDTIPEIQKRLLSLLANLKVMAPNANINIISYPTPMQLIIQKIDDFIKEQLGSTINLDFIKIFMDFLNDNIKTVAKISNVNYVQIYNWDYWKQNSTNLASIYFDIHPNTKGYKKIALDLYLKITNPSLRLKDYQNYDFNQEFLREDSSAYKYQIQVDASSYKEVLGKNSQDFLNYENDEEKRINLERSSYNFGTRIAELTNIFSHITHEVFDFLVNNVIYNELDPDGFLKELLTRNNSENISGVDEIVNSIVNSNTLQHILSDLQNRLVNLDSSNQLNIRTIGSAFKSAVLNGENLATIIRIISKSKIFHENSELLRKALKNIIKNTLNIYGSKISEVIVSPVSQFLNNYETEKNNLHTSIQKLINSDEVIDLFETIVDTYVDNLDNFENITNFNDIILAFLKNPENNQKISQKIVNLLKKVIQNKDLKQLFVDLFYKVLVNNKIDTNITKDEVSSIFDNIITLAFDIDNKVSLIQNVVKFVLNDFHEYGIERFSELVTNAFSKTFSEFSNSSSENSFNSILKIIINSKFISENTDFVKKIITNIFNTTDVEGFSTSISNLLSKSKLSEYISQEGVAKILQFFLKQNETKEIIFEALSSTLDNINSFENVQNINQLIVKILGNLDLSQIERKLTSLVDKALNNADIQFAIKDILSTYLIKSGVEINQNTEDFLSGIISYLPNILNDLNIMSPIFEVIFTKMRELQDSEDVISELKNLPSDIFKVFKQKTFDEIFNIFKKVINQDFVVNNKEAVGSIVKVIFYNLKQTGLLTDLINTNLSTLLEKPEISKYIDKDEILHLVSKVLNSEQIGSLIEKAVSILITERSLLDKINKPNEIINQLLKNSDFKQLLKTEVQEIVLNISKEPESFKKTIKKVIFELAKQNQTQIDEKFAPLIENLLPSIINTLKSANKFDLLIQTIFNSLSEYNDINEIGADLATKVLSVIDFKDIALYKNFLNSPIFNENKQLTKEFIQFILQEIQSEKFDNILNIILSDNLISNVSKEELKTVIKKILTKEEFKNLIQKTFDFVIDNSNTLSNSNSLIEMVNVFIKDANLKNEIKPLLTKLLEALKDDETFDKIISNLLLSILNNSEFNWIFEGINNKETFAKNIFRQFKNIFFEFNFVDSIFNGLDVYAKSNTSSFAELGNAILNKFLENFTGDNQEQNILKLIKLFSTNFINENKNDIKIVIKNVYNHFANDQEKLTTILNSLYQISPSINDYVLVNDLSNIVHHFLSNENFRNFFNSTIDQLLEHSSELSNITSLSDVLFWFIKNIDKTNLKTFLEQTIQGFKTNTKTFNSLKNVLIKLLNKYVPELYIANTTEDFLNDFITDILNIDQKYNVISSAADLFIKDVLTSDLISTNFSTKLTTFGSDFSNEMLKKIQENLDGFITDLFRTNSINNHPEYSSKLLGFLSNILLNKLELFKEPIINLLKTQGLLSDDETINDSEFTNIKKLILQINNIDSNQTIVEKILTFTKQEISQITNLQSLIDILTKKIPNALNIQDYKLVKTILNSDFLSLNSDLIKKIFEKAIQKYYVSDNIEKLVNSIDLAHSPVLVLGTQEKIKELIKNVLNNQNTKDILKTLVNKVLEKNSTLKTANSYNELLKMIFGDQEIKNSIKPLFTKLLEETILDNNFKDKLKEIIANAMNLPELEPYLKGVQDKNSLAESVVELYSVFDSKLNIKEILFESLTINLSTNGIDFSPRTLLGSIFSAIKAKLSENNNFEQNAVELIKAVLKSNLFTRNKNDLITIFDNLIQKFVDQTLINDIYNNLSAEVKATINKYIPEANFKTSLVKIVKNEHFIEILKKVIKKLLENTSVIENETTFIGIVKKVFSLIELDEVKTHLKEFTKFLLTDSDIKDAILSFLKQTLTTYEVEVNDNSIDQLLRSLIDNSYSILNNFSLVDAVIDSLFNDLKLIANTNTTEELNNKFSEILEHISQIITTNLTSNIKQTVDKLLQQNAISSNLDGFKKLASQLVVGLNKQGVTTNLLTNKINNLPDNQTIFEYIAKNDLINLVDLVLKNNNINEILKVVIPQLVDNTEWLNSLDNPFNLIKQLLNNEQIKNSILSNATEVINSLIGSDIFVNTVINIIEKVIVKYNIDLTNIDKRNLIRDFILQFKEYITEQNLTNQFINLLIESLSTSNNINEFSASLTPKVIKLFNFEEFASLKAIFKHFKTFKNNAVIASKTIQKIYESILNNDQHLNTLLDLIPDFNILKSANVTKEEVNSVVKLLLKNAELKAKLEPILHEFFVNFDNWENTNSFNELVRQIFSNTNIKNNLISVSKSLIDAIVKDTNFKTIISKILIDKFSNNSEYSSLFTNINNKENVIKTILNTVDPINKNLDFIDVIVTSTFNSLSEHGTQITIGQLLRDIISRLSSKFTLLDFERRIITTLNEIVKNSDFQTNKSDMKQFISNVISYALSNINIAEILWGSLGSEWQTVVQEYFLTEQEFKQIITGLTQIQEIKTISTDILNYYIDNVDTFANANSFMQIFKKYLEVENNKNKFKQNTKSAFKNFLKNDTNSQILNNVLVKFIKFLEVPMNEERTRVLRELSSGFADLLDRAELFDKLLDGLIKSIQETNTFQEFSQVVSKNIITQTQLTTYTVVNKILQDDLIQNNKQVILGLVSDMITRFINDETKLRKFIKDYGITSLLVSNDHTFDKELIVDMLVLAIKNPDLRDILNTSISEFISKAKTDYYNVHSWTHAINVLLNSSNANNFKQKITNWIKSILINPDQRLVNGIGALLVSKLKDSGFAFNEQEDLVLTQNVIRKFFEAMSQRNELSIIIGNIYDKIKAINPSNILKNPDIIYDAIKTGALKIILTDNEKNISFKKILDQFSLFDFVTTRIGDENYVKFFNRLFETSNRRQMTGIYKIIKDLFLGEASSDKPQLGFQFDESIFTVIDRTRALISTLFKPVFSSMIVKAGSGRYNFNKIKENAEYKLMYRMSALILWLIHDQGGSGAKFWNIGLDVQGTFKSGLEDAFNYAKNLHKGSYNKIPRNKREFIGESYSWWSGYSYNGEFILGNRSAVTTFGNFWNDQLLAYIYYRRDSNKKEQPDRHNRQQTMTDTLLDSIERGYLGNLK